MNPKMYIYTPYGDKYIVDLKSGNICQPGFSFSGKWKFTAFVHVKKTTYKIFLRDIQADPTILSRIDWRYKNGHPQYTVMDCDYGTTRIWGNARFHGVGSVYTD